ncbi:hypothetical protein D3C72_2389620 [compost metagenome]
MHIFHGNHPLILLFNTGPGSITLGICFPPQHHQPAFPAEGDTAVRVVRKPGIGIPAEDLLLCRIHEMHALGLHMNPLE